MAILLKIEWWNDTDLGDVLYQDGYKNRIYLDVEVEKPEYNTVIESEMNGDNVEITKFRKWEKVYKFECWMQEDLLDAFSFMQIHDKIEVTLQSGDVIQVAKHGLRIEPSWEEVGCLAKVVVSFTENYVVAGNCDENKDLGCLCADSGGDFKYIVEFGSLIGEPDGTVVLAWTVENLSGRQYTGKLYQFSYVASTWVELPQPDQYTCWENLDDGTTWIWDGQYWHLFPGYVSNMTNAGADLTLTAWILLGTFATLYMDINAVPGPHPWTDMGDYTADELSAGLTFTIAPPNFASFYLDVWNHSCDYGETEEYGYIF